MPDNLKSGIENLSGYSMNEVKVHYNSSKPAQLNAHAYAQGTDIHVSSGQEKHLPHEAWHVVQQKQGRVKPTMQMKGKVNVNDDTGLEKEADLMGGKAAAIQLKYNPVHSTLQVPAKSFYTSSYSTVQRARAKWVNPAAVASIDGDRAAAAVAPNAGHAPKAGANDYIKGTHYDGPHHTPTYELIDQMNNHYAGKYTGLAPPLDTIPVINASKVLMSSSLNATYRRPFEVKARTSVARGKGRSNQTGIETDIGYMGADEARLHGPNFATFNGGHLVGDQMMDSHGSFLLYEDWNLAPQHAKFNSPIYLTTMENAATAAINAGADIEYTVNVQYPSDTYNLQASQLAKTHGVWQNFGGVTYGNLVDSSINNGLAPDQAITFTNRIPGYWRAHMKDLNLGNNINSTVRHELHLFGVYSGSKVQVNPNANYNPVFPEYFRYTAEANGAVMGPLPAGHQHNLAGLNELTLTTRQETY